MCFERVQKVDNEKTLNINKKIKKSIFFCDFLTKIKTDILKSTFHSDFLEKNSDF